MRRKKDPKEAEPTTIIEPQKHTETGILGLDALSKLSQLAKTDPKAAQKYDSLVAFLKLRGLYE
ncbi:MAG: hypothetical protein UY21_C0016G0006 [Microgenomates group bacterium GW2011_GWA1_48_10]|uniref:Uncharacterized protein n=1 Tax=Candidatus Gottesmanbacteria bacterium RIFCSPHIGHO2_01_FULL_47_48 TaxID=1798381 RepID=A0A1F6A094_9BACT|nr:MAG: hypothetical protein UY21_C0016G0006 [Microgenomates group bacterium GW2011_GWA1_48_10]OGG17717.1 MAG: hypothetical protein A2721_00550 [Candidatus Gottesmanbacteria bacterium RIFCSPHIGHO2_01_FULL_47_48]